MFLWNFCKPLNSAASSIVIYNTRTCWAFVNRWTAPAFSIGKGETQNMDSQTISNVVCWCGRTWSSIKYIALCCGRAGGSLLYIHIHPCRPPLEHVIKGRDCRPQNYSYTSQKSRLSMFDATVITPLEWKPYVLQANPTLLSSDATVIIPPWIETITSTKQDQHFRVSMLPWSSPLEWKPMSFARRNKRLFEYRCFRYHVWKANQTFLMFRLGEKPGRSNCLKNMFSPTKTTTGLRTPIRPHVVK